MMHDEQGMQADLAAFEISFSPQFVQVLRPPSLYCPPEQISQRVSVPLAQGLLYPSPTAQDEHGTHADFESFGLSLALQGMQELSPPTLTAFLLQASHTVLLPPITQLDIKPSPMPHVAHGTHADFESFGLSLSRQVVQEL
jgi:hypothetical protein